MAKIAQYSHDPNYWTFTVGLVIFLFIVYITGAGELRTYIQFFFYRPPNVPPTRNPASAAQTGAPVIGQNGTLFPPPKTEQSPGTPGLNTDIFDAFGIFNIPKRLSQGTPQTCSICC